MLVLAWVTLFSACSTSGSSPQTAGDAGQQSRSPFVADILSDGVVSHDEIDEAGARVVSCIQDRGYDASIERESDRIRNLSAGSTEIKPGETTDQMEERFLSDLDFCSNSYWSEIAEAWSRQEQPSEEERQQAFIDFQDCIEPSGYTIQSSDIESFRPLVQAMDDPKVPDEDRRLLNDCFRQYQRDSYVME